MTNNQSGPYEADSLIAIFDIGKTRSKLVIQSTTGSLEYAVDKANTVLCSGPYTHLDAEGTWQWMLQSLSDSNLGRYVMDCIVVTHGAAFALLDGNELAVPVMDYEFDGYERPYETYQHLRGDFSETFSPALPAGLNAGRQIAFIQETMPVEFDRVSLIVPYPQFWAGRFSAVYANEVTSLGSHTDLWCPATRSYSSLVVNNAWLNRMPPIRPAWEVLAPVLADVAAASGLNPRCRIHCGIHDSNASYLRHLSIEREKFCVVSTGTWVVCMAGGHALDCLDGQRDMLANVDVNSNPVACARFMGGREFAALSTDAGQNQPVSILPAESAMAAGRFAMPSFSHSGGPFPGKSGYLVKPPQDVAERRALASLYCALMTDVCLENLGASGDLIVAGRFIDDLVYIESLSHFRADQTLRISDDSSGTIAGASRLADWPNAVPALPPAYRTERPAQSYVAYRDRWRELLTR